MNLYRLSVLPRWKVLATGIVIGVILTYCVSDAIAERKRIKFTPVGLSAKQHIGSAYAIPEFYVDGNYGSNVGRGGGGGRTMCCFMLPKIWRPDLAVDVRWAVNDWSDENLQETAAGNYRSIKLVGIYRARVPIEKYDAPGQFTVHFFKGGRVRVVSGTHHRGSEKRLIVDGDDREADVATIGTPVSDIFSADELAEMERKRLEHEKEHGSWK